MKGEIEGLKKEIAEKVQQNEELKMAEFATKEELERRIRNLFHGYDCKLNELRCTYENALEEQRRVISKVHDLLDCSLTPWLQAC